MPTIRQRITPFLWFDNQAEEAVAFGKRADLLPASFRDTAAHEPLQQTVLTDDA